MSLLVPKVRNQSFVKSFVRANSKPKVGPGYCRTSAGAYYNKHQGLKTFINSLLDAFRIKHK